MKILKFLGGDDYGGQFICECQFITHWREKGIQVDAYILGKGRAFEKYKSIVTNWYELPEINAEFGGGLKKIVSGIFESYVYVRRIQKQLVLNDSYDAVIYRSQSYLYLAAFVAQTINSKAYWHLPNSVNRVFSKLYYNIALRLKGVIPIANSRYTKNSLGRICTHVVYPGFNMSRVKVSNPIFRLNYSINQQAIVFGTAARLHPTKAQDLLIEAFIKSDLYKKGAHLLIAGISVDDDFKYKCEALAKGYENYIHFLGNVDDMASFYSSIDVYVNSRIDAEPFGISIAEALGACKPVIAYYEGGPSEMIENRLNGILIYKSTIEQYLEALLNVHKNINSFKKELIKETSLKLKYTVNANKFISIIKV